MAGDPYAELGVPRSASADDIQKAFRKLAKELHPDRNPNNKAAEDRFKRVSGAFDLLKDPDKRKKYDAGQMDADGRETHRGFGGGGGASGGYGRGAGGNFDGVDLDDIFDIFGSGSRRQGNAGGGFGGGFGGFGGGGANPGGFGQAAKGNDLKIRLDIDLMDTIAGNTRRVQFTDGRTVDVNIPKGAKDGQTLRLKGQGAASPSGRGPHGDALVELTLRPHPVFRPEGNDLHMDLYVAIPDAVLGGKVQAPTPDGPVNVTIAKGSNSGGVLRLKGRGGFDAKTNARGDLFAKIVLALPDKVDDDFVAYAEDWRKDAPYTPSHPATRKR
ncbi:DnaJ C-terminal domain-containing protein [Asticcacaulis sp. YBE204]|uniref:DnaJ C-terminal domain-containing protein n=1 Tax=Asticcacaulis sp. YBE204 TaxID=1282363 RepID=UPI0003C3DE3E|nr:DnaJ C-terminal domain-containing protein [Asticcacaulis sp. YBE204]ESQ79554.1 molecular chaperone DnaJ [Asticcacaulis sp. YBE204]